MTAPRILVLRGGAIGDFVVTLPAIRLLRERWPAAHIELVGYPHIASLAAAGGLVDRVRSLDSADIARLFSLRPDLPDEQREYLRSFHVVLSYLYDPYRTVRQNLEDAGVRQVLYVSPLVKSGHAVEQLLEPLAELAIYPEGPVCPTLSLTEPHRADGRQRRAAFGPRIVALHPGSGSPKKNWPLAGFLSLAEAIEKDTGMTAVFLLGEADEGIARKLKEVAPELPVLPGGNLVELAGFLSACEAYVGNDSGITHLAAALGIPVVALYGPTDPATWGARGPSVTILRSADPTTKGLSRLPVPRVRSALFEILGDTRRRQ